MAKNLKPYEVPLEPELASEILSIPLPEGFLPEDPPTTIGEAVAQLQEVTRKANDYLAQSSLAAIVADTVMRRLKKRGKPSIRVRPDGTVILHVAYDERPAPRKAPPVQQSTRTSDLPKLAALRAEAAALGVDISDLGRARRAIHDRLSLEKARRAKGGDSPPTRLLDDRTESELPPEPKAGRKVLRRRKMADGSVEETDVNTYMDD
jgi:hypothetical protein